MIALQRRPTLQSRALVWSMLLVLPALAFLFFTVSLGMAMIVLFAVLFTIIVFATAVLVRQKLAYQRHERQLLAVGRSR